MNVQSQDKPLEVLVMDDDPLVRELLSEFIAGTGSKVDTAANGQEGLEMYSARYNAKNPYDGVITDLNMPGKSGIDVIKEIKSTSPQTPVYVITGDEGTTAYNCLRAQLGDLSPNGIIEKPFKLGTIADVIQKIKLQMSTVTSPQTSQS
jgi:CheY-like chemotaxis protein